MHVTGDKVINDILPRVYYLGCRPGKAEIIRVMMDHIRSLILEYVSRDGIDAFSPLAFVIGVLQFEFLWEIPAQRELVLKMLNGDGCDWQKKLMICDCLLVRVEDCAAKIALTRDDITGEHCVELVKEAFGKVLRFYFFDEPYGI